MTFQNTSYNFRSATAIPLEDALARFPSLASETAAPNVSDRYQHISTADQLRALTGAGFDIFSVQTKRTIDENRRPYVKHAVRLRQRGVEIKALGDSFAEICWINDHGGKGASQLFAGLLRAICLNGLMVGTAFGSFRVPHFGRDITGRLLNATAGVVESFGPMAAQVDAMRSHLLTYDETQEFAERALVLRYGDESPFNPAALDVRRRVEDSSVDLWTTFNRVQENLVRGGARATIIGNNGRMRRTSMRAVNGLDSNVKLNRALWDLAADYLPSTPRALAAPELVI